MLVCAALMCGLGIGCECGRSSRRIRELIPSTSESTEKRSVATVPAASNSSEPPAKPSNPDPSTYTAVVYAYDG